MDGLRAAHRVCAHVGAACAQIRNAARRVQRARDGDEPARSQPRLAAASRSRSQRVATEPRTPLAGTSHRSAPGANAAATASALSEPATRNQTSSRPVEALERKRYPVRRRLRRVVHRHRHGVGDALRRVVREQRRDVTVRTDAEQDHVELALAELTDGRRVRGGARLGAGAGVRPLDPEDLAAVQAELRQARVVVLGVVAVRVAGRQVPLVAPPHVDLRPVHGAAPRGLEQRREDRRPHRPAGQGHLGHAARRHGLDAPPRGTGPPPRPTGSASTGGPRPWARRRS